MFGYGLRSVFLNHSYIYITLSTYVSGKDKIQVWDIP